MKIIQKLSALVRSHLALVAIFLLFLVACCFLLVKPVHAQSDCDPDPNLPAQQALDKLNKCAIEKNIFDDKIFNINQIAGTADSILSLLSGQSQLHPDTNGVTAGTGALAASGKLVATLYRTPPVSGVQYFAQKIQKFNPVQPAYAQTGIGFDALQPAQKLWQAFRNISYIGFVLVFVVIGFMVMFRAHISPQAVATVQDTIPRVIIALILVTFSYAIAGLMIDVMFLFLNIVINTLKAANLLTSAGDVVFEKSVFGIIWNSWTNTFKVVYDALSSIIDAAINLPMGLDKIAGFFGGAIGGIIVGIALLFIMFRVFFMLLMAYAMIILLTIAAPFFFLIQALPGNNGAKEWFKQMAANVSVFPVTALMFIFAGIIGGIGALGGWPGGGVTHTDIGQFPLLAGDIDAGAIGQLIGIGFLLMTPEAANMVKKAIGAQGGLGAGFGAGAAALGAAGGFAGRRVAQSAPGQAVSGLAKYHGEKSTEKLMNIFPSKEGRLIRGVPSFRREKPPGTNQAT